MANHSPKTSHLKETQWKSGQSGNPKGKPKGTKNLSTWIRDMLEDENFELKLSDGSIIKEAPIKAIVSTLINKAVKGDLKAFDLLGKYGYANKLDFQEPHSQYPVALVEFIGLDEAYLNNKPAFRV